MPAEVGAPKQHKQPSRKGKRAWRKNVDLTEVQDGLDALREEIIQTGSGPISEQKADELFAVDTIGSEDVRKKLRNVKPLKVDEILAKRSAVPAIDGRKRSVAGVTDGVTEPANKRQKKDWVSRKEVQRLRQVAGTTSHLTEEQLDNDHQASGFDLWAVEEPTTTIKADKELEYVPTRKAKVAPSSMKKAPTAMTVSGKPVRSVRHPDAGTSYNPDFEQWDDLLNREGAKELQAEQARLQKEKEDAERQARVDAIAREEANYRTDDESAWEGFETEREGDAEALKQKRPQRKTPAQRNKIKRRKEAERLAKHEKRSIRQHNASSTSSSTALISRSDDDTTVIDPTQENAGHNLDSQSDSEFDSGDDTILRRRRLGPSAIPTKNLELVLPDELQESLRQLKPEGNLLQDRFRNLLVNGKIESRKPVTAARKKKVKMTEKWSHKDFRIEV